MQETKESYITKEQFPLVIEPKDASTFRTREDVTQFLQNHRCEIQEKLLKKGALLFRGFPLKEPADFNAAVQSLKFGEMLSYVGGDSPRKKVEGRVYTSTEAPKNFKIPLHQEMSFIRDFPRHIYFFCEIAPQAGGQTIIADGRKILEALNEKVRRRFSANQLKYVSHYWGKSWLMEKIQRLKKGHKSWMDAFETNSPPEVEKQCKENDFFFRWHKSWLEVQQVCPAIIQHPVTNENVWFNQAHLYDFNPRLIGKWSYLACKLLYAKSHTKYHEIYFDDNNRIKREDLYHVMDVLDQQTVYFEWQRGDFLVLDNVLAMHGRAPFKGPRRILTALTR